MILTRCVLERDLLKGDDALEKRGSRGKEISFEHHKKVFHGGVHAA